MKRPVSIHLIFYVFFGLLILVGTVELCAETARGRVFVDANRNGTLDPGESGVSGVLVSNQHSVVRSDQQGRYEIPLQAGQVLFLTKPAGYRVPLNNHRLPQFYYIHSPAGGPEYSYRTTPATGPLPEHINFPLYRTVEQDTFTAVVFSDPQTRDGTEVRYVRDDVITELAGTTAAFGITLGDIMFDDLTHFDHYNEVVARSGIPFWNVPGNHDMNFDAPSDSTSLETYKMYYGPTYYAFEYGKVHFILLDDVRWINEGEESHYEGWIGDQQLTWLDNHLDHVERNKFIVLAMHIPLYSKINVPSVRVKDLRKLLDVLKGREQVLALAGHHHMLEQSYIGKEQGRTGTKPIHMITCAAVSGSWWEGPEDVEGIPVADQRDGVPNGYHLFRFAGTEYTQRYKAARETASRQMHMTVIPPEKSHSDDKPFRLYVNVYNASPDARVTCVLNDSLEISLERTVARDPSTVELYRKEPALANSWVKPHATDHLWKGELPEDIQIGLQAVRVEVTDPYAGDYSAVKFFRVTQAVE